MHNPQAVKRDPGMITGAWILMAECDYVWMKPMQVRHNTGST